MNFPNYKNKKILILGLGLLGRGVQDAIFFAKQGAKVTVTDLKTAEQLKTSVNRLKKFKNVKFVLGKHREQDILKADLIIRNAGVPFRSKYLQLALKNKIPVEMDESLFAKYCPCPIIGITGTRGKTTTTTIIAELLKETGQKVHLAGNILGKATLPLINKVKTTDLVVLELSSWQLQGFGWNKMSPQISIFTNLYPDHLNTYKNMTEYFNDKKKIFKYQTTDNFIFLNKDQKLIKDLKKETKSNALFFTKKDLPKNWNFKMPGEHNLENMAAALAVGKLFRIPLTKIKKVLTQFPGVEDRLEFIKTIKGVDFINDTTSTTPIAGIKALNSIKKPIILLAGGATKKLDLTPFAQELVKKVKAVILLEGTATEDLEKLIKKYKGEKLIAGRFDNFKKAVLKAYELANKNETVLLSPGCASFGMFTNEFDRGDQFKKIVKKLK